MITTGRIRYVFTSSNTSRGFQTFIPELLEGLKKVYVLKGPAGSGKSTFMRLLGESLFSKGYEVEFWMSALDPVNFEGVYIPQLEVALVNGSLPQPIDPKYPGVVGEIIYFGEYWDKKTVSARGREIVDLVHKIEEKSSKAYNILRNVCEIKENIKKVTSEYLNIGKIQNLIEDLTGKIIEGQSGEKHYFADAVTPDGAINYIEEISRDCRKRYIFKGPPGSGKSTVINEIARRAREKGYFLEYYHCGLDSESISMVIIRNLQMALIDAGNIELAINPWDIIIDLTTCLDDYDEDLIKTKMSSSCRIYESLMLEAQEELKNIHQDLKELKKIYSGAMDFEFLDQKREEIIGEIIALDK